MAGNRWAKARDKNERAICSALRAIPWPAGVSRAMPRVTVAPIEGAKQHKDAALPSAGVPDLLVGVDGHEVIIEVKYVEERTNRKTSKRLLETTYRWALVRFGDIGRELMPHQLDWARAWRGSPTHVVTTGREACAALGLCGSCGADDDSGLCPGCAGQSAPGGR